MGVPSLYRWVTQRYPEIKLKPNTQDIHLVDNLYLDFNAIIHPCCNKSLGTMTETDTELYRNLESYIDDIIAQIRPGKLLYISVDGVAPRAKLNQQRARRFVHAKEVTEQGNFYFKDDRGHGPIHRLNSNENLNGSENSTVQNGNLNKNENALESSEIEEEYEELGVEFIKNSSSNEVFDINSISPGTEFMHRLDIFIQDLINFKLSFDQRWNGLNVIYSGYQVPGEGEQKIMRYIRKHQNPKLTSIIFSPDADLIFLGLSLFEYSVMILREEPPKPGDVPSGPSNGKKDFVLVNITKLKRAIIQDFKHLIREPFNHRRFLEDWIFLCFTVGNDFLPCSPCFEIRADALDKLVRILQKVYLKTKDFITDNGKINHDILRVFFTECAKREDSFIVEKRNNQSNIRKKMNIPPEEFFLETERGKIKFYIEKMGIKSEEELLKACEEYIKGMEWIYKYYFHDIPSWDWFYPYHFAPFMVDLARVKKITVKFNMGKPLKPLEQLLTVLPPLSKGIIPVCLHPIFEEHKEFYPTEFKLDMFQKCMNWQAVPILPFIRVPEIVKAFEDHQRDLTFEECARNATSYPIFFSKQTNLVATIYPLYTELKPYGFIKTEEFVGRVYTLNRFLALEDEVEFCGLRYLNKVIKFTFDQRKNEKK